MRENKPERRTREPKPEYIELGRQIREAREAAGLTHEQLAQKLHIRQQSVSDWERGLTSPSRSRMEELRALLPKLRTMVEELLDIGLGVAESRIEEPQAVWRIEPRRAHLQPGVPIVGTVRAGADRHYLELEYPTGHGDGRVAYRSRDRNAYAVRVEGESMVPRIRPGEFVIVEPSKNYRPGDDVMVSTKGGQKMVKQFLYERDGQVALDSINSVYERITIPRDQIEAIHYIVAITKSDTRDLDL